MEQASQQTSERRDVLFIEELAAELGISRRTIERRRRTATFPIPTLQSICRRPMWGREDVERYKRGQIRKGGQWR